MIYDSILSSINMTNVYSNKGTACSLFAYPKKLFVENLGAPWSSGAWGPGPNGPVVNPPLRNAKDHLNFNVLAVRI